MARMRRLAAVGAVLIAGASAFPAFSTPNSVDVSGHTCPLVDRSGLVCPILCVRDQRDCPAALAAPECAAGEQLCADGGCHASCADVANPCLCGRDPADMAAYAACPAYGPTVAVVEFDPAIKQQQIEEACLRTWGMGNASVPAWGAASADGPMWGECPGAHEPQLTFTEPFCLAFYAILGAELVLFAAWHLYKSWRERNAHAWRQLCALQPTRVLSGAVNDDDDNDDNDDGYADSDCDAAEKMPAWGAEWPLDVAKGEDGGGSDQSPAGIPAGMALLRGFDGSWAGLALYVLALASTAGWFVVLAVVVADYYGAVVGGVPYGLLANSNTSMIVFIFVWHAAALWHSAMLAARGRLRNYFRLECPLAQARVVQVEERQTEEVLTQGAHTRLTAMVGRLRASLVARLGLDIAVTSCPLHRAGARGRPYIEHRCARYTLGGAGGFEAARYVLGATPRALLAHAGGLTERAAGERARWLGENIIRVRVAPFPAALLDELFSYFYLYQMLCFWVWCYFAYYKPALIQMGIIIGSALIKTAVRQRSERRIKSLAERRRGCRVRRGGVWMDLDSAELVPGDAIALEAGMELMCDGCVVRGDAVMDESSLTGEAMPVRKLCLEATDAPFVLGQGASRVHSVFAGTRVVQCLAARGGGSSSEPATQVLVLGTRTQTDQGALLRRILYPAPQSFVFDEQLRVALLFLLAYGGVCFGLSIWLMGHDVTSWFYGLFLVSQVAAPLLPAALVAGQTVAASRLRRMRIFCIDLPRILMAGKARVFCFDKTGTLTKSSLDYHAVHAIHECPDGVRFAPEPEPAMARLPRLLQVGFAACHAVAMADGSPVGNPVDVAQFCETGWTLGSGGSGPHLEVLEPPADHGSAGGPVHTVRRHEFQHARQSMSVAVLDPATGHVHVFVKGSFERIRQLAAADRLPADYDAVAARWAQQGCYVLALATRDLGPVAPDSVALMAREELEDGCVPVALLLFRNQLKDDTAAAIAELRAGGTRTVMVTGDAALTGVYIARACGMVDPHVRILLGDMDTTAAGRALVWRDTETNAAVDDVGLLLREGDRAAPVELAVTAAAFEHLDTTDALRGLLLDIRVFARMTPHGKVRCVRLHMERAVTAMCGDGGNDSGALRAAHVGLALSEAEASIVSPFSTSTQSARAAVDLLRQGRAAVATSVAAYKFVVNYATTMAMLEITQFYFSVIVSQAVWITIDGMLTISMVSALTQLQPARRLHRRRPTARLLGAHTLASIWGQTAINHAFLFGCLALLFRQQWFRCHEFDSRDIDTSLWWLLADNYEAEVISIVCLFQFINAAAVYNFGYRFRRAWATNYPLLVLYGFFMALVSAFALADPNALGCWYHVNCGKRATLQAMGYRAIGLDTYNSPLGHNVMPRRFRWTLWALCATNVVTCLLYEKIVVLGPVGRWVLRLWRARFPDRRRVHIKL